MGNLGHYAIYPDLGVVLVLISDAPDIKSVFGQSAIFFSQPSVPLRLKTLSSVYYLPVKRIFLVRMKAKNQTLYISQQIIKLRELYNLEISHQYLGGPDELFFFPRESQLYQLK